MYKLPAAASDQPAPARTCLGDQSKISKLLEVVVFVLTKVALLLEVDAVLVCRQAYQPHLDQTSDNAGRQPFPSAAGFRPADRAGRMCEVLLHSFIAYLP